MDRLTINRKLFYKASIFTITTLMYFILRAADVHNFFNPENGNLLSGYIRTIMIGSLIISAISLFITVLVMLKPAFLKQPFFKVYYHQKKWFFSTLDWLSVIPVCAVLAMFINIYLFSFNQIDGPSMEPTFYSGETVAMFPSVRPERFDVVVVDVRPGIYENVRPFQELYIKRLIGLPGDTVEYRPGEEDVVYINGVLFTEGFPHQGEPLDFAQHCEAKNAQNFCSQVTGGVATIPEGHYLVIGDNRYVSYDSRMIGYIRAQDIVGIVKYKISSIGNWKKI
jgi:signal peptidase I